jgi:hypothetical protein
MSLSHRVTFRKNAHAQAPAVTPTLVRQVWEGMPNPSTRRGLALWLRNLARVGNLERNETMTGRVGRRSPFDKSSPALPDRNSPTCPRERSRLPRTSELEQPLFARRWRAARLGRPAVP